MKPLILHCGGQVRSRQEVFAVPVPPGTASYTPVPHELLLKQLDECLAVERLDPRDEKLAVTENGQRLFGLMELQLADYQNRNYGCVLGLRNSYDRSFAPGLCAGAMVFVCDNLGFYGSHFHFQAKGTAHLLDDLPSIISAAVARLPAMFDRQSRAFEAYRRTKLDDQQAQELVALFFDGGGLEVADVPKVLNEWQAPHYREFCQAPKTAWRLLNAATEIIKGNLWSLPEKTFAIHRVLDEACSIPDVTAPFEEGSFHSMETSHSEPVIIGGEGNSEHF